ncbi:MAG: BlaI/MecI/CopY family transcriptional regulator, partial [Parcubacteria group bacterium]
MAKISARQLEILEVIREKGNVGNKEIRANLPSVYSGVSRFTILRDLDDLVKAEAIKKTGEGRSSAYQVTERRDLMRFFAVENYFNQDPD